MMFCVVGIAHAPLTIREKVSFSEQAKLSFQEQLYDKFVDGCVIVSTCNRSEVYVAGESIHPSDIETRYRDFFDLDNDVDCFQYVGREAVTHLFQVCAGLDSQIIGEDQILKQVKDAYAFAQASQMCNKAMHMIFQEAFHFSKQLKHVLKINEYPTSSSYLVYKFLKERDLLHSSIAVCGSGDVMQSFLPYVKDCSITIMTRHVEKANVYQEQYANLRFVSLDMRYEEVAKCDVLLSATASPHPLFRKELMPKDGKKRILFDMAVPRDIMEDIKELPCYEVYNIDEIQQYIQLQVAQKKALLMQAQGMLIEEVDKCIEKLSHLQKEPVIAHMQQHLSSMALDTFTLLDQKLTLSSHEQRIVKKTLEYSYLRFLKDFTSIVKESNEEVVDALQAWMKKGGE